MHLRPLGHLSFARQVDGAASDAGGGRGQRSSRRPQPPVSGGERGIRTHGTLAGTPDFESGTFGHSVSSPSATLIHRTELVKRDGETCASPSFRAGHVFDVLYRIETP